MAAQHPDHLYKMPRMNRAFALSSVALLLVLVWMVAADYVRDWKMYQARFNRLDVEKTLERKVEAETAVDAAKLEEVRASLEAAAADIEARRTELAAAEAELAEENAALYAVDQNYRFAKADLDAMKFEVEEARSHSSTHLEELEHELDEQRTDLERKREALLIQQEKIAGIESRIKEITARRDTALDEQDALFRLRDRYERKLAKITPDWRGLLLNMPMLDFVQPTLKIKQVILPDLRNDVNFLEIPRVDRCMTCHVGINQKGFEDAGQPFRTHPRIELFVGDESPHPMGGFGCTTCHYGHDRGTSFHTAAHWPSSKEQKAEWKLKYDWHPLHHWDEPMLPMHHIEASCRKCHVNQIRIPEAKNINRGLLLVERYGCHGCHKIRGFEDMPKSGPDLRRIGQKLSPEWTLKWIKDPRGFRPKTRMPHFWDQVNTSSPEYLARNDVEADAIVAVLYERSETGRAYPPPPVRGDAERGERLVAEVGCMGCHQVGEDDPIVDRTSPRQFGPDLNQVGSKTSAGWMFAWLKDPVSVSPTTRMPSLRLTDQEAADITAFLITRRSPEFEAKPAPKADPAVRDDIVRELLGQKMTSSQVEERLGSMSEQDKRLFLGEKFVNRYGCFGCHLIQGYEDAVPIGTELSQWASKYLDQLDFGLLAQHDTVHETEVEIAGVGPVDRVKRTRQDWAKQKLLNPRIFDMGRVRRPEEKLKMPNFGLSEEDAHDLVTALMSFTKERMQLQVLRTLSAEEEQVEEGRRIVLDRNCQGCHPFHEWALGQVGSIREPIQRALVKYEGRSPGDAETVAATFSPPTLDGEGAKVNPDWFFNFLKRPSTIRPWLKVRMPSFGLADEHANAVITHFARYDKARYPFLSYEPDGFGPKERQAAAKLFSEDYFSCLSCHQQGARKPAGPMESWAPDLALARERLRPDWIARWIRDPQALQPGTRMPTFYDPEDPALTAPPDILGGDPLRQIEAMRDYIYALGEPRIARR